MENNKFVLLITGPSGAGKSTVARQFAQDENGVVIDIEHINFMFVGAFHEITASDGCTALEFDNWKSAGETIGLLAKKFTESGTAVVIHGHINNQLMAYIEGITTVTHKVMLLPEVASVILRDKERGNHQTMGDTMVRDHYKYFTENQFKDFVTIDSTHDTVKQTVAKIGRIVKGQPLTLIN